MLFNAPFSDAELDLLNAQLEQSIAQEQGG